MTTEETIDHTVDAFHRGAFHLVQPKDRGHRAGLDAMLLASALPSSFGGTVVDLGAGSGAAGLAVLSRCRAAKAVLVEKAAIMTSCAEQTLALSENAEVASRTTLLSADVSLRGAARHEAGLPDAMADAVILNPPFNDPGDRRTSDALRHDAHVMTADLFEKWLRTAAAISRADAWCAMICRPRHMRLVLDAMENRFGGLELRFIHPRASENAIRLIVRGRRNSRAPTAVAPSLTLHGSEGSHFTNEADALINGEATLF